MARADPLDLNKAVASVPLTIPPVKLTVEKAPESPERVTVAPRSARHGSEASSAWLTLDDLAKRLNVCTRTLRRMVDCGTFPRPVYLVPEDPRERRRASMPRWSLKEVEQWEASRLASRRTEPQ